MKWVECISPLVRWQAVTGIKLLKQKYVEPAVAGCCMISSYRGYVLSIYHSGNDLAFRHQPISPSLITLRNYAKGKDKKKDKGKQKVAINESMLAEIVPLEDIKNQMQKSVDFLKGEYIQKLSIRSSTGAVENIHVSFEGKDYSVQELGQVVRKDTKTVVINMVAFPQAIPAVLKSLQKSGMNLNPQQDGTSLFIPIPKVTTEHRNTLAKNAKALFINCRDTLKNIEMKHVRKLKDSSLAQDIVYPASQQLSSLAEDYIKMADSLHQTKVKELLGNDS